jgi:hypothetical protein
MVVALRTSYRDGGGAARNAAPVELSDLEVVRSENRLSILSSYLRDIYICTFVLPCHFATQGGNLPPGYLSS